MSSAEAFWRRYDALEVRLTAAVSERMLELASLRPGLRVLDLATGRGEPAIRAAHRVAPGGSVLGLDADAALLALSHARAEREGVANLELRATDACRPEGLSEASFDAALCRWGLMYLPAPVDALVAAHHALRPGAPLVAALWAEPERVSWATVPRQVLARFRALPPLDLEAPGAFHYADVARFERDLAQAGFGLQHAEELETPVVEAETPDGVARWARELGGARSLGDAEQDAWEAELAREVEKLGPPFRLGGVTRLVVAVATR
jgi:ubiquinone/menaquinone biosynthesis C-methylase UbiE